MSNFTRNYRAQGEPRPRSPQMPGEEPSRTRPEFAREVDVNVIMGKFRRGEAIQHFQQFGARYGDASPVDLSDAMILLRKSEELFMALPADLRKRFKNDAREFFEFVQNPDNQQEAYRLGIGPVPDNGVTQPDRPNEGQKPSPAEPESGVNGGEAADNGSE